MSPAPMGASISDGPTLSPGDSGMWWIQYSLADQEAAKSCITAHRTEPSNGRMAAHPDTIRPSFESIAFLVQVTKSGISTSQGGGTFSTGIRSHRTAHKVSAC